MSTLGWEPRLPLTAAEQHVDYPAHYNHVTDQRAGIEKRAARPARQIAFAVAELGLAPIPKVDALSRALDSGLVKTMRFGYDQARAEIHAQREQTLLASTVPDAGRFAEAAAGGLAAVRKLIADRARQAAEAIAAAALAARLLETGDMDALRLTVSRTTSRALHNHVLELVGETLNLGRAAGALSFAQPPEFALRSEQLDKATCDACTRLHGSIAQVGSAEFYDLMPPSGCYGGGRCRGIWVFSDSTAQVLVREAA